MNTQITLSEDEAITVREGLYLVLVGIGTGPVANAHRSRIQRLIDYLDRLLSDMEHG